MADRPTYEIQGYEFTQKRRTKANIDAVRDIVQENEEKRAAMYEWMQEQAEEVGDPTELDGDEMREKAIDELGYDSVMGPWEVRRVMFEEILDGPHEHIDIEQVTWDELEEVRTDFLPPQMRLLDALREF